MKRQTKKPSNQDSGDVVEVILPCLSLPAAAMMAKVTERTVRTWINRPNNPLPALLRDGRGPPVIYAPAMIQWLIVNDLQGWGAGDWGGRRR